MEADPLENKTRPVSSGAKHGRVSLWGSVQHVQTSLRRAGCGFAGVCGCEGAGEAASQL